MNQPITPPADTDNPHIDPRVVSTEAMKAAIADGIATHLSQVMTGFARYLDTWWIKEIGRWLEVDDPDLIGFLDKHFAAVQAMQKLFDES